MYVKDVLYAMLQRQPPYIAVSRSISVQVDESLHKSGYVLDLDKSTAEDFWYKRLDLVR